MMMRSSAAARLFEAAGLPPPEGELEARLDASLREAFREGAGDVPAVPIEDFAVHVAPQCTRDELERGPEEALAALDLADLAFALACARGDRGRIAELERTMIDAVPKALTGLRADARLVDEVRQELRAKLLVGDGTGPKLLEYRGRGPLAAWTRVVALRIGYALLRDDAAKATREDDDEALAGLASEIDAPDVAHLRATYAAELRAAFAEAARRLAPEERAVLRSHAIDGLTIDQIGALYQVHRATAARWVQQARASLLSAIRETLSQRLGIDRARCESVVALVQSRIDLSLERVLREPDPH